MKDDQVFKFTPSVIIVPILLVSLLFAVFIIDDVFNLSLNHFGIVPRTLNGAIGVVCSPFLHGDWLHLLNNSVSLFILTAGLIFFYRNLSLKVLVYGVLFSGIITWIIGRNSTHIGASGLIYVMASFIFFKGLMTKYFRLTALSLGVVLIYGSMIWYVFPDVDNTISWEGHLSGFITGFLMAHFYKTPNYQEELVYDWEKPDFNPEEDSFMKRFDEQGNFINPPKPEEETQDNSSANSPVKIVYEYKETKKDAEN